MPQTKALGFILITSMKTFTLSDASPSFSDAMPIFLNCDSLRLTAWPVLSRIAVTFCSSVTVLSLPSMRAALSSRQSPTSFFISTMASEEAIIASEAAVIAFCARMSRPGISDSARLRRRHPGGRVFGGSLPDAGDGVREQLGGGGRSFGTQSDAGLAHERAFHVGLNVCRDVTRLLDIYAHQNFIGGRVIFHDTHTAHGHPLEEHAGAFLDAAHVVEGCFKTDAVTAPAAHRVIQRVKEQPGCADDEEHQQGLVETTQKSEEFRGHGTCTVPSTV